MRWSRRTPSRSSSCATLRLTVDVGMPSSREARTKLPTSATFAKTKIAFASTIIPLL